MDEQLNIDVNLNGIKSLKTELKEANLEYQKLLNSSAATAEQINKAAQKVGYFKDQIKEANERAQALGSAEGKIAAIGNAAQTGVSAFQAYTSIMVLTGHKAEEFEETMKKLQAVMALQQSIKGLEGMGDAFKNVWTIGVNAFKGLKVAIGSTGIGLLVVALGMIVANFDDIKAAAEKMFPALKNTGALFDKVKQTVMGVGTAIKDYIFTPFKFLGKLIQGDIKGAIKELQSGLSVVTNYKKGAANEEIRQEKEKQDKLNETRAAAEKERDKQDKEARAKLDAKNKEAAAKAKAEKAERDRIAAEKKKEQEDALKAFEKAQEEHIAKMNAMNMSDQDKEQAELSAHYSGLIEVYNNAGKDTTQLLEDFEKEQEGIRNKYADKEAEDKKEADAKKIKSEQDLYQRLKEASDKYINDKIQAQADIFNNDQLDFKARYAALDEQKKLIGEKVWEGEREKNAAIKQNAEIRKQIEMAEIDFKKQQADAYIQIVAGIGNIISTFAGKNKKAAKLGVIVEKAASIASIVANTAAAIAKSNKDIPFPGNIPVGIAYGVSGAAGIASTIMGAKQALAQIDGSGEADTSKGSKYAKGGLLMGRKHAEGGIMTNFGELEGGEFVVNRSATKNFLPMLEKINSTGNGSGAPNNMSTMMEPMNTTPIIKTYVVASEVTSQQEAQRKIANLARL